MCAANCRPLLEPLGAAEMIEPDSLTALVDAIDKLVAKSGAPRRRSRPRAVEAAKRYDRIELADRMLDALQALQPGGPGKSAEPPKLRLRPITPVIRCAFCRRMSI